MIANYVPHDDDHAENDVERNALYESYLDALRAGESPDPRQWSTTLPEAPEGVVGDLEIMNCLYGLYECRSASAHEADLPPRPIMERLGTCRVISKLDRGSFGSVYLAHDEAMDRLVALKVLDPPRIRTISDELVREARAVAQLRHPNIVPVHNIIQADGREAIVSGYIDGVTLKDFIRVRKLNPREAVAVIWELAIALHYAHSQGVVHRDVKPANIIIEADTDKLRPILVDFGLALRLNGDATAEDQYKPVGTPAYRSPEQAAGKSVDCRSDEYSLGLILYELLHGELPSLTHADSFRLAGAQPGPASQPRHADLEAICDRATAHEPQNRFCNALEFADELQRWLNHQPTRTLPPGPWKRLKLRCRREPKVMFWMSVASLVLLVGLGWVNHERVIALRAREQAEDERMVALRAKEQAEHERVLAFRAQQQEELARKESALLLLQLRIGESEQRNTLLGADLANQSFDDAQITLHRVAAENDPRRIQALVFLTDAELARARGFPKEAQDYGTKAFELFQELTTADPLNCQAKQDLGHAHKTLGDLALDFGSVTEAQQYYGEFLSHCESLLQDDPENRRYVSNLAVALEKVGNVLLRLRKTEQAEQHYLRSLKTRDRLPQEETEREKNMFESSAIYDRLGDLNLHYFRRIERAKEYYQKALELSEKLPLEGNQPRFKRALSIAYEKMGDLTKRLDGPAAAIDYFKKALELSEQLEKANPANAEYKRDVSFSLNRLGDLFVELDEKERAQDYFSRALKIRENLAGYYPRDAQAQRDLAFSYTRIADVLHKLKNSTDAIANYAQALRIREALANADVQDSIAARAVLVSHDRLAQVCLDLNELDKAREHSEKALQKARALESSDPSNLRSARDVSVPCNKLGDICLRLDDPATARDYYMEALRIREKVAATDKSIDAQVDLATSFGRLGRVEKHLMNPAAAIDWLKHGVAILQALKDSSTNNAASDKELKEQLEELARLTNSEQ